MSAQPDQAATTVAPDFRVVPEHVARNPVARAIAVKRIEQAARDFALRVYLLKPGDDVRSDCHAAATVLAVSLAVLELQGRADSPDARVIAGSLSGLSSLAPSFRWRPELAVSVDQGLQRAVTTYREAPAGVVQRAYVRVRAMDGQ
ncbi:MAG: hypothetical protein MUF08_03125 [Burkholderiaceae bacterium]|nr:hypothetical protein [Burkholderiaceae bacterium]MCU0964055.1 hypothetical protein [Burkholderiaceae bacterium]